MASDRDILRLTAQKARLKSSLYWAEKSAKHLSTALKFYENILEELSAVMWEFNIDVPQDHSEYPMAILQALRTRLKEPEENAKEHP